MTCRHWSDATGWCGTIEGVRSYLPGRRCPEHTPAALAGRPESLPDPELALDALRDSKGLRYGYRPSDSALLDKRAIASGKRRSTPADYRLARS